jgi:CHASE3 domain sensor protein
MNSEKRVKVLLITLFISLVFIILLIYFYTSIQKQHIVKSLVNESYCSLYNNDTVLSFEIDDISFSRYDLPILENALFLAKNMELPLT